MKPFSTSLSNVGSTAQPITNVSSPRVIRFTVKCRSLGSNTYIGLGDFSTRSFRLTAVGDSLTFVTSDIVKDEPAGPEGIDLHDVWCDGDNGANDGVIEIVGVRL